jgi:predicted ArsR family transcriptional regulator
MTDPQTTADRIVRYLRVCRREGALWTSDIAHGARIATDAARRELGRLEAAGTVRRVVIGNPTSWELVSGE